MDGFLRACLAMVETDPPASEDVAVEQSVMEVVHYLSATAHTLYEGINK